MNIIELKGISQHYWSKINNTKVWWQFFKKIPREKLTILSDINLTVEKGECVSLVGLNGAGKSTLIKIMTGLLKPTQGEAFLFGKSAFANRRQNAQKIGVIFGQKSQLWWDLSLVEAFEILQKIYGGDSQTQTRIDYLMTLLDIHSFAQQPIRELSFGQRMRGEFVACFLHCPEIVFLDEPTVGLDVVSKRIIIDFLREINQQEHVTILLASHELDDVEKICRHMYLLNHQKLVFSGQISDFKASRQIKKLTLSFASTELSKEHFVLKHYQNALEHEILFYQSDIEYVQMYLKQQHITTYQFNDASLSDILVLEESQHLEQSILKEGEVK